MRQGPAWRAGAAAGTATGKLLLFGEHSAVHGHPAIGVSLPERTRVDLAGTRSGDWDLGRVAPEDRATVARLLQDLDQLAPEVRGTGHCRVAIYSTVARGIGLGSSAALCAALASAALAVAAPAGASGRLAQSGLAALDEVWALAHALERGFHGTPSGVDTGLALHPGVSAFRKTAESTETRGLPSITSFHSPRVPLIVGAVPRSGDCAALIRGVRERMRAGDPQVSEALGALGRIAAEACDLLAAGPGVATGLGWLANGAMVQLRKLGLADAAQDRLIEEGLRTGALGGKLSGAGAGGAFYLVYPDRRAAVGSLGPLRRFAARDLIPLASPLRLLMV